MTSNVGINPVFLSIVHCFK